MTDLSTGKRPIWHVSVKPPDLGAIAPGRYADLIAVDGDPLGDIRALETVAVVMKAGQIVKGGE
jgi:imidazolonepropionase-like amidohydrolase